MKIDITDKSTEGVFAGMKMKHGYDAVHGPFTVRVTPDDRRGHWIAVVMPTKQKLPVKEKSRENAQGAVRGLFTNVISWFEEIA